MIFIKYIFPNEIKKVFDIHNFLKLTFLNFLLLKPGTLALLSVTAGLKIYFQLRE